MPGWLAGWLAWMGVLEPELMLDALAAWASGGAPTCTESFSLQPRSTCENRTLFVGFLPAGSHTHAVHILKYIELLCSAERTLFATQEFCMAPTDANIGWA